MIRGASGCLTPLFSQPGYPRLVVEVLSPSTRTYD